MYCKLQNGLHTNRNRCQKTIMLGSIFVTFQVDNQNYPDNHFAIYGIGTEYMRHALCDQKTTGTKHA